MKAEKVIINGEEQVLFDWNYNSLDNKPTLGTAAAYNVGTDEGEIPVLGANGKLDPTMVPSTGVMNTYTVTNKSDLTTISNAVKGDIAIVTSENKTYILSNDPYSTLSNWTELLFPTGSVSSVNGFTGAVNLTTGYIQESNNNLFVSPTEKATWNNKLGSNNVSTVALTGNYNDLNNKPVIDTVLNATSTNAVQNKAIATAVNTVNTNITTIQGDITTLQNTTGGATQDISDIKGDITTIQGDVTDIQGDINDIQGDITSLQTTVAGKQDTLVSGTNIKTINNESILGDGNIDITSIVLNGGSTGTFLRGAQQAGEKHAIDMGTDRTYTFQGLGYVLIRNYYGWACEINGIQLFYRSFNSGTYNIRYPYTIITMGPGDVVRLWRPGNTGGWDGEVADFY